MREFFRFYGRVLRVAYGGARGQARAAGFYIALVAGAARIFGYDVVLTISTATVTTIAFAGSLAVMLVWAPYVVFAEEKARGDKAMAAIATRVELQAKADALARFVHWGSELHNEARGTSEWFTNYLRWHSELEEWTAANLPEAEHLQIASVAPLAVRNGDMLSNRAAEHEYKEALRRRLGKLRIVTGRYQDMAYGR